MKSPLSVIVLFICAAQMANATEQPHQPKAAATAPSRYECGTIPGSTAENECIDRQLRDLDVELNRAYKLAFSSLPKHSPQDTRKEQKQLRLSQLAWSKYKDENCALVGGLDGEYSQTITFNALLCREHETRDRIKFLNQIANANKP